MEKVSIVVIGLNVENHLENTFNSVLNINYPRNSLEIIYSDTGSTDRSVEIAKKYVDKILYYPSKFPTAALGRNMGLVNSKYDVVHFIDGDIQIDKNYLINAIEVLKRPDIHCVYGKILEKNPGVNQIMISHWNKKKEGFSDAPGAGGTFKKNELLKINGYDERIQRGEETDLGERFRYNGYKIYMLNKTMGIHNYGMRNISDAFKKFHKNGISTAYSVWIPNKESNSLKKKAYKGKKHLFLAILTLIFIPLIIIFNSKFFSLLFIVVFLLFQLFFIAKQLIRKNKRTKNELLFYYLMFNSLPLHLYASLRILFKKISFAIKGEQLIPERMDWVQYNNINYKRIFQK